MSTPSPELRERILERARSTPSATRSAWLRRWQALPLVAAVALAPVAFVHGVPALGTRPVAYLAVLLSTLAIACTWSTWLLIQHARTSLGPSPASQRRGLVVVGAFTLGGVMIATLLAPEVWTGPSPAPRAHLFCATASLVAGGVLALAALGLLRHAAPRAPALTAFTVGAWAATLALFAVTLECAMLDPTHVLLAHLAPGVLLALVVRFRGRATVAL